MSSVLENRALLKSGRSVHFRDFTWKKNRKWKMYLGFCPGEFGVMKEVLVKVPVNELWTEEDCDREIQKFVKMQELATKYNKNIRVMIPQKAIIDRTAGIHNMKFRRRSLSRDEWVLIFEKMDQPLCTYVKRSGVAEKQNETLEAFVHFAFHETGGQCVVSKLRGVRTKSDYILACPSLFTDQTDVMKIMSNHRCNDICNRYLNPQNMSSSPVVPVEVSSVQPSAPPEEDFDSDDDVFTASWASKDQLFALQLDNRNQYFAIPCQPGCGQLPGQFNMWFDQPPAYSSHCPIGHRPVICASEQHLLLVGDTAPVQQTSAQTHALF